MFKYLEEEATLTELESEVIANIVESDFVSEVPGEPVWAGVATETNPEALRGALASLVKKGYVNVQPESQPGNDDSLVWVVGYEAAVE